MIAEVNSVERIHYRSLGSSYHIRCFVSRCSVFKPWKCFCGIFWTFWTAYFSPQKILKSKFSDVGKVQKHYRPNFLGFSAFICWLIDWLTDQLNDWLIDGCDAIWCDIFQVSKKTSAGNTALHIACLNGQDGIIDILVTQGAGINALNAKNQVNVFFIPWYFLTQLILQGQIRVGLVWLTMKWKIMLFLNGVSYFCPPFCIFLCEMVYPSKRLVRNNVIAWKHLGEVLPTSDLETKVF